MKRFLLLSSLACALTISSHAATIYVSSDLSHEVLRYESTTGAFIDVFMSGSGLNQPHAILERCDDILVASFGTDQILRFNRFTGAFINVFIDAPTGLDDPVYLLNGPDDNLYITSQASDEVLRFTENGVFINAFVTAGSGGLDGPSGMAFGPDGRLYVAGRYSANVIAYNGTTGAFDELIADSRDGLTVDDTFGLIFGGNGDLYFVSNGTVYRYDLGTSMIVATIPVAGAIGLDADLSGAVYVASSNNLRSIDLVTNAVSAPILTGGTINVLNFFHFAGTSGIVCPAPGTPATSNTGLAVLVGMVLLVSVALAEKARRGRFLKRPTP